VLQGSTSIGAGSDIGPRAHLVDTQVGERAEVAETVAHRATIGDDAVVGPYAVLDAGAAVVSGARTGPFYTSSTG
jgi:bifunctional UDP-N-acetylglucosamine pyrophosphorylase/glucosamine-1-phosphate N-acetyltransferase